MKNGKTGKKRPSFWQTLKAASGPYRRLYGYVKPYRARFVFGLSLGFVFGMVNSLFPLVVARVTSVIFHGAAPNPMALRSNLEVLNAGPKINSLLLICLAIPAIMTVRSLCSYGNSYCMNWVSNKVVTDIRNQLFGKIVRHSMEFFNKMQAGFLISRITNDTRGMQMALTTVSSDLFKQPITIVGGIAVLLLMDWRFTVVTLVLFPICLLPIRVYGRRARKAVQNEQEDMGQMVVTMQETFAGIRVIKSFSRDRAAGGNDRGRGRGPGVALCLRRKSERRAFFWADLGDFYPVRADQNTQQNPHRDAEISLRHHRDFQDFGFGASRQ